MREEMIDKVTKTLNNKVHQENKYLSQKTMSHQAKMFVQKEDQYSVKTIQKDVWMMKSKI